jgi:hypothetical protein
MAEKKKHTTRASRSVLDGIPLAREARAAMAADEACTQPVKALTTTRCRGVFGAEQLMAMHDKLDGSLSSPEVFMEDATLLMDEIHVAEDVWALARAIIMLLQSASDLATVIEALVFTSRAVSLGFGCSLCEYDLGGVMNDLCFRYCYDKMVCMQIMNVFMKLFKICRKAGCTHSDEFSENGSHLFGICAKILTRHPRDRQVSLQVIELRNVLMELRTDKQRKEADEFMAEEFKRRAAIADAHAAALLAEEAAQASRNVVKSLKKKLRKQKPQPAKDVLLVSKTELSVTTTTATTVTVKSISSALALEEKRRRDEEYEQGLERRRVELLRIAAEKEQEQARLFLDMQNKRLVMEQEQKEREEKRRAEDEHAAKQQKRNMSSASLSSDFTIDDPLVMSIFEAVFV